MSDKPSIEKRKITDFQQDNANANQGTERGLRALDDSLAQVGLGRSIVVDKHGNIIAGNKTQERAVDSGFEDAIVIRTTGDKLVVVQRDDLDLYDIDPNNKARLMAYLDNRVAELDLQWDSEQLYADKQVGFDLNPLFSEQEQAALFEDIDTGEIPGAPEAQIDRVEELNQKWQVQSGDLWIIPSLTGDGEHRLLCGDSTNEADVARLMSGDVADFEFSDPPYELDTVGGGVLKNSAHMKAISNASLDTFDPQHLEMLAPTALFCCNKRLVPEYIKLAQSLSVSWDICFYRKSQTPPNYGGHMMTDTEYLMLLGKQSPTSGLPKETYSKAYLGDRDADAIVAWQKPVGLVHKFLKLFSSNNGVVIDRFGCTGTTMVACEQLSRQCRMVEIEPKYCAVILERMSAMGCEPRKVENTPEGVRD